MINPFIVMKEVEEYFYLKPGSLVKHDRHKTTANARAIAMYILRSLNNLSYLELAEYFDRDHKCIINGCNKIIDSLHNTRNSDISRDTIYLINQFENKRSINECQTCLDNS